jgi:hypothetical protein
VGKSLLVDVKRQELQMGKLYVKHVKRHMIKSMEQLGQAQQLLH